MRNQSHLKFWTIAHLSVFILTLFALAETRTRAAYGDRAPVVPTVASEATAALACGNGICEPDEGQCNCPADCGPPCDGDLDKNGIINLNDLLGILNCASCIGASNPRCDVNCDGAVDLKDIGDELCRYIGVPAENCCTQPHGACLHPNFPAVTAHCIPMIANVCQTGEGQYVGNNIPCPPGPGDCNANSMFDVCETSQCTTDADCDDGDPCTCDHCECELLCIHLPVQYGDTNCDCIPPNLDDILCVLNGFANYDYCTTSDIHGGPPCEGDGDIDLDDILAVLSAFSGTNACLQLCGQPCPVGACCSLSTQACTMDSATHCFRRGVEYEYKGDGTLCPPLGPNLCL